MKPENILLFFLAIGLILQSLVSEIQSRRIKNLQVQIDELRIIANERFLPAMIFDKHNLIAR